MGVVTRTGKHDNVDASSVFGDIDAKMRSAIDEEVAERLRLGLPVIVDEGRGIEDLSARSMRTVSAD